MFSTRKHGLQTAVARARTADPVVEIQNYVIAGDGRARVMIEVTHNEASRKDANVIASALKTRLGGKLEAVAGSFKSLEKGRYTERLVGVVAAVRQAIPFSEGMNGFKAVASNMFMDDEKDMWVLRKTEAGGLLVKTTGIDDDMSLIGMLDACASDGFRNSPEYGRMAAMASSIEKSVEGGNFVSYVNNDNRVVCGYVVASVDGGDDIVVLPVGATEGETIKKAAVTEIHQAEFPEYVQSGDEEAATVVAAARGNIDINFILDYYKKVYARNPAFYDAFAQRLQSHQFM
jgi:hypothetical protein